MILLLDQLFTKITGKNLPDEIHEKFYHLLRTPQKKIRNMIVSYIKEFSKMTPFQLRVTGWSYKYENLKDVIEYIKGPRGMKNNRFKDLFYRYESDGHYGICEPVHTSVKSWSFHFQGEEPHYDIRVILYFSDRIDMINCCKRFTEKGGLFSNSCCLDARDCSHYSRCVFCDKFLSKRSEKYRELKHYGYKNSMAFDLMNKRYDSSQHNKSWDNWIMSTPLCIGCRYSKERQDIFRRQLIDPNAHYMTIQHNPTERILHNQELSQSVTYQRKNIPQSWKPPDKTPLDYVKKLSEITDTHHYNYWNPQYTADEYIWRQENRNVMRQ